MAPRWLADEMLGRLARYLRFMGFDTAYARGVTDSTVRDRAEQEGRTLLTRDRALARSTAGAVLLLSPAIDGQLTELHRAFPELVLEVRSERCTRCNGSLRPWRPSPEDPLPPQVPAHLVAREVALHRCTECGHIYWEGSHAHSLRRRVTLALAQTEG